MGLFKTLFTRKVKKSGTTVTVKQTGSIGQILNNVHPIRPQRGVKNPAHVQPHLSPSISKKVGGGSE